MQIWMFPGLLSHILAVLDYIRYKFEWLSSFGEPSETYIPPQLAHNAPMSPKDKNILDTLNLLVLLYRAKKNPTNTLRRGRDKKSPGGNCSTVEMSEEIQQLASKQ